MAALALAGCQQTPYKPDTLLAPTQWATRPPAGDLETRNEGLATKSVENWWTLLNDPAIDALVDAAFASSPDLEQALARMDAASGALDASAAAGRPTIAASATLARGSSQVSSTSSTTELGTAHTAGLSLSWELDLFGRIKAERQASQLRLDARVADATGARVSLASRVMDGALAWRACDYSRRLKEDQVESWQKTLALTRQRLSVGAAAPVDEARTLTDVSTARVDAVLQRDNCTRTLNSLVELTGLNASVVLAKLNAAPSGRPTRQDAFIDEASQIIPAAPPVQVALPATVLAQQPAVVSAQRDAQAAWSDIGIAQASRYPRLDLVGLLTGQWLRAGGQALNFTTWSAGPTLSGVVYDGGSGAAQVNQAEARFREARAKTVAAVRAGAHDVEDALSALSSANDRAAPAHEAAVAAYRALSITQQQWEAGGTSLLHLEDARRQSMVAQTNAVAVARDRSQSWIALVRATGNQGVAFMADKVGSESHAN